MEVHHLGQKGAAAEEEAVERACLCVLRDPIVPRLFIPRSQTLLIIDHDDGLDCVVIQSWLGELLVPLRSLGHRGRV